MVAMAMRSGVVEVVRQVGVTEVTLFVVVGPVREHEVWSREAVVVAMVVAMVVSMRVVVVVEGLVTGDTV